MLLKNFYSVQKVDQQAGAQTKIVAHLQINKSHEIFQGHFPGLPIVPGVCMVQIIKELLELQTGRSFLLNKGSNIKFLSVINPEINSIVMATVFFREEDHVIHFDGMLYFNDVVFFKIKGELTSVNPISFKNVSQD